LEPSPLVSATDYLLSGIGVLGKELAQKPRDLRAMPAEDIEQRLAKLEKALTEIDTARAQLVEEIQALRRREVTSASIPHSASVTTHSKTEDKLALFRSLFAGRSDVYAQRWDNPKTGKSGYSPACHNEWVKGICDKPRVKCGDCPNQAFKAFDEAAALRHLTGKPIGKSDAFVAGVYPMLPDETCWFLAVDFDKKTWQADVAAFRHTAAGLGVPVAVERSRSGNGAHAWIFFSAPIPASEARRLGSLLITATMKAYPDLGFESYDRLFPNQDTMPAGGFGNLIALPLQHLARENGNSLFVDVTLMPYADQWAYLSTVKRMDESQVGQIVGAAASTGDILGVSLPVDDEETPWSMLPSRRLKDEAITGPLPERITIVLGSQVFVPRDNLPPTLVNKLVRIAAFQNPEFYAAQSMRLPTFGKPRIISCAELFPKHVALPRGCLDDALSLFAAAGIKVEMKDERNQGAPISTAFVGKLTDEQTKAAKALLASDTGVLAATTAFGKTVVAANLIAERQTNTLILVHRRQLVDQWVARLKTFLDASPEHIGVIHGGKKKPTGHIDIAVMQSLVRNGVVADRVADYGQVIVDECHHLSAVSFEALLRETRARYVAGLSATVARKDGHHPIIFMQCGPVRYRVDAKSQAALRPFHHQVTFRNTAFRAERAVPEEKLPIQEIYKQLAADQGRNDLIFNDILEALEAGRSPVVITERKEHLLQLAERLGKFARNVIVLHGGMGIRQHRAITAKLAEIAPSEERIIVATGRYLGEGFDDPRLDTLFLTMPISWRGTLAQYAGRLHRLYASKTSVRIYDYRDGNEAVLSRMAQKRESGYRNLGYNIGTPLL
jgi:superfamily II DNA or RNA helicase